MGLLAIRPGERRNAWTAFFTLFGLIGSHAILETARDALFLAKVPTSHLPWVFLSVATLSLVIVRLQSLVGGGLPPRQALAAGTLAAGFVTFAFYALFDRLGSFGVYALYTWSGLLTTLLLVSFWTMLGNLFSITQGKRLYGFIGAGSVSGAIVGTGIAGALARHSPAQRLLIVSAIGFMITAGLPFLFRGAKRGKSTREPRVKSLASNFRYVRESVYARRVVAVLLISTICLTLSDFVFKTMVPRFVPAPRLGEFLGTVYFVLNLTSLFCQLVIVGPLLKRTSLGTALAVLPVLLACGAAGIAAGGGMIAVIALKGSDGALRYSLHRTACELLFLPFKDEARQRIKGFMDVIGQRGGQVVASLLLLALARYSNPTLALVLLVAALGWIGAAFALRAPYIEIFRERLNTGHLGHLAEFPELDVASLETLISALDSKQDEEVIAALQVLERENKAHLVPALILYHPSERVVELALRLFARTKRTNVMHVLDRVLDHPSPRVRAATIAGRSVLAPDAAFLLERMRIEKSSEVRATIIVNLIASGAIEGDDAKQRLDALLREGSAQTKVALAEAVAGQGASGFDDILVEFSSSSDRDVRRAAVAAMARAKRTVFLPVLIACIGDEATRADAARALAGYGNEGLAALRRALEAKDTDARLRWRIPHAISFFDPRAAASTLLARLPDEPDRGVRFQIIRALERIVRRTPDLVLPRKTLTNEIHETVSYAFGLLESQVVIARGSGDEPRVTAGYELLRTTLLHKERNAIDRLFRLLALAHSTDDFWQIHRGLSGTPEERAISYELIENILVNPLRGAVRGLVDDTPHEQRLQQSGQFYVVTGLDYEAMLHRLEENESEAVREVAKFHLAELLDAASEKKTA